MPCENRRISLDEYALVRFSRKSGKIDTVMTATGNAMLRLWALQNCPKSKDIIIFHKTRGDVVWYLEGQTNDMPKVYDKDQPNVEEFCPGLLAAVNE